MALRKAALAAVVLACVSIAGTSRAGVGALGQRAEDRLQVAAAAYDKNDCVTALGIALPIADAPAEKIMRPELAGWAYAIVAGCETDKELAYGYAVRGTALAEAPDELWSLRLALELDTKRTAQAVATVETLAATRPDVLNTRPIQWMAQLRTAVSGGKSPALRERLLKVLASDRYHPNEPFASSDSFRVDYANILADKGDLDAAKALVLKLDTPDAIQRASVDARLRTAFPADPDLRSLLERRVTHDREILASRKDLLEAVVETSADLRRLGRFDDALVVLDAVSGRIDDPKAFSDRDDELNWWLDARGRTLFALGRYDEGVAVLRKAAAGKEAGQLDVSQVINLAEVQNAYGRGADALETLKVFNDPKRDVSPYGAMEMRFARVCAHALAGRVGEAAQDLSYMREHERDHPEALFDALMCVGDMEGAAAAVIRRLDDPERREDALLQLADYDAPSAVLPPHPVYSKLDALKRRPDVAAAVAHAGGLRRFNIQRDDL